MKLTYTNRPTTKLTDDELKEYSELFNNNYGFYRDDSSLRPGESVTFRNCRYASRLNKLLSFSEDRLKEAYARMDMDNHLWASKTVNEVDFISNYLTGTTILDLGCGRGRHSIELAKHGYTVTGIDFVESNIAKAKERSREEGLLNATFLVDDIRGTRFGSKYDAVICLYDVIGSFANENDNKKVLRSAYNNLAENGVFILSVLNMELTEKLVPDDNRISIKRNPERLFSLSPQNHMQKQGEIFDGQNMLIDIDTGLVIRKEQFDRDNALSAEYIVRDKRYRMDEIVELVESIGFSVIHTQYTHAGFSDSLEATDNRAKEILIVAQKC